MRLAPKLLIFISLIVILPLFTLGALGYSNARRILRREMIDYLDSINAYKQGEFEQWLHTSEITVRELARRPSIQDYAGILTTYNPPDPVFIEVRDRLLKEHLTPAIEESTLLDISILRLSDGLILVSTDGTLEGKYHESEPFFIEGQQDTYIQDVVYSLSGEGLVMHISTPVKGDDGELIAVLAAHMDLDQISEIMQHQGDINATEETYLVNKFNFMITESRFEPGFALKKAVHTRAVTACLEGASGIEEYENYRADAVIGAYRWMAERELCILTEMSKSEAFQPVEELLDISMLIGFVISLVAIVLGILFARTITTPLAKLVRGTQEIAAGNLDYQIHLRTRDEIGQLAVAFNDMTSSLAGKGC